MSNDMSKRRKRKAAVKSVRLGEYELELLRQLEECGLTASEVIREALRERAEKILRECRKLGEHGAAPR
jgi:Arc/MetJ-type ribon-helix-helix transcriptional regulator